MSRLCIIGDVHGMLTPLRLLVRELDLQPSDKVVFVGDLIDKGPDPAGVVSYVEDLRRSAGCEVVLVEGNHEDRMRRYLRNLVVRPAVAKAQAERAPELAGLRSQLDVCGQAFLDWSVPFHRCAAYGVLIVHGGIPGTMQEFPASLEAASMLAGHEAKRLQKILRTRYLDADTGEFLALGKQAEADPFWAEVYDGRFGHVVFGHQPFPDGPAEFPHATGIDTGAVHGGGLTALVFDPDRPRYFVTVESDCHIPYRGAAYDGD